jgi:long-chain fatty acid transport protein
MKKILVTIAVSLPFLALAQGFQVSLQGQRQQAMAGTGTAYIQDGASLFYNPGGVSFLKNNSASIGVTPVISHVQYSDAATSTASETKSPVSYPFTGYLVMGKQNSKLKYGIAAYTPFGSTIDWEKGWTGRFVLTHLQLFAVYIQPTVSYRISDKLGIGAGFVYSTGKVNLQRDIPVMNQNGDYASAQLDGKASGMGFNAGIYYQPTTKLSLGFTYRSKVDMKLEDGNATFTVPASLASNFPNGKFSTSLPLPSIMSFGMAVHTSKHLILAVDANRIGWNTFDTLSFDYANNTDELSDTKSPRKYEDAYSFRLGAQYEVNSRLNLAAGIKYLGTPVKDGYVSPDVPDAANVNYSIGLGYKLSKHVGVDASFTYQTMNREDKNLESGMQGTYKTNLFMPGISFNYNF